MWRLVPGTSFGDSAKDFVRVSYANSMENLEKAIYKTQQYEKNRSNN